MTRFCVTLACITALVLGGVCNAKAAPPPVVGGHISKQFRMTLIGLVFRCREHVYPGGIIVRCVLAKSPDAA